MNTVAKILDTLRTAGKTISTAESLTVGHLQTLLGSVSGASDILKGGITAYQRSVKVEQLGVDDALARRTDCVDAAIAQQMALGALKLFKTDYAVATCGYAECDSGSPYAFFAIAEAPDTVLHSERIELTGNRVEAQQQAAQAALEKLSALLS